MLSHGQSSIERGFSVNKELLVEHLNQRTLIGQRKVYDYFSSLVIDINEYEIPPGPNKRAVNRLTPDMQLLLKKKERESLDRK